jgi:hypothetical protein
LELKLIRSGIPDLVPMVRGGDEKKHVSYAIRRMCLALGHYEDRDEDGIDDGVRSLWGLGSAFEDAVVTSLSERYALTYPGRYVRTGELELDGLLGNPDLFDTVDQAVEEMKLTKMSSRRGPEDEKFWKYWVQVKAYCRMMEVQVGRLHVCYINGNYKRDDTATGVEYKVWEARFTKIELINNWKMIRNHAG